MSRTTTDGKENRLRLIRAASAADDETCRVLPGFRRVGVRDTDTHNTEIVVEDAQRVCSVRAQESVRRESADDFICFDQHAIRHDNVIGYPQIWIKEADNNSLGRFDGSVVNDANINRA